MNIHAQIMPLLGMISSLSDGSAIGSGGEGFLLDFSIAVIFLVRLFLFALSLAIFFGLLYAVHLLFSLPLRRAERARLFLDLLEGALQRGQSVEAMILSIAQSCDRTVGVRFHMVAAYVESGLRFGEALGKVPRFLPPQITAMLHAGEKLGDLKKVLPACREILRDRPAAVRSGMHYLIVVVLLFSPAFIFIVMMTMLFVVPKFKDVASGMGAQMWPVTTFVFALVDSGLLLGLEILITLLLLLLTITYVGGPGFVHWFQFNRVPVVDWLAWRVPWKKKRLQRTFSAMLAVLLDGGVPETEAIRLAGDSTANEICRRRSRRVMAALEKGVKLDTAVRAFDDSGEFQWRLTNATHAHGGFLDALRGWHEALDAKAFQQEEATAHVLTSGLVVLNGVFVALIATAMFGILMVLLNAMVYSQ